MFTLKKITTNNKTKKNQLTKKLYKNAKDKYRKYKEIFDKKMGFQEFMEKYPDKILTEKDTHEILYVESIKHAHLPDMKKLVKCLQSSIKNNLEATFAIFYRYLERQHIDDETLENKDYRRFSKNINKSTFNISKYNTKYPGILDMWELLTNTNHTKFNYFVEDLKLMSMLKFNKKTSIEDLKQFVDSILSDQNKINTIGGISKKDIVKISKILHDFIDTLVENKKNISKYIKKIKKVYSEITKQTENNKNKIDESYIEAERRFQSLNPSNFQELLSSRENIEDSLKFTSKLE
jgi:hypothetical protein